MNQPALIGFLLVAVIVFYILGLARGRRNASVIIDNPRPGPTADKYYHTVSIDGDECYFTQEQVDVARQRADNYQS